MPMLEGDRREACCQDEANLERVETTNPLVYIKRCRVCQRNHYHFIAPPGVISLGTPEQG